MSGYTLTKNQLAAERRRLTVAQRSGDPEKIITACERSLALFERCGFPDSWACWEIAKQDAQHERWMRGRS